MFQRGSTFPFIALALAGWIRYASGKDESGQNIDVRDPLNDRLASAAMSVSYETDHAENIVKVISYLFFFFLHFCSPLISNYLYSLFRLSYQYKRFFPQNLQLLLRLLFN